jgi:hypothetical protein
LPAAAPAICCPLLLLLILPLVVVVVVVAVAAPEHARSGFLCLSRSLCAIFFSSLLLGSRLPSSVARFN